jgi:spore germination cell wall hydrolase CwlJ-like protein
LELALPSIGHLEIAVPVADDRSNRTIRELRASRRADARVLTLLARAVEFDAQPEAMAGA